jgi:hypothetical protein
MSVRVRYKLVASVSSSSAEEKDLGNATWEVYTDQLGEGGTRKTTLAVGATDVQLPLDNIASAKVIIVRTNATNPNDTPGTVNLKLNNTGATPLPLAPMGDAKEAHFVLASTGMTALYASNPGAVQMDVTVIVAGD